MKPFIRILSITVAVLIVVGLYSCEKKIPDSDTGKLAVSLNLSDDPGQLKSAVSDSVFTDTLFNDTTDVMTFHLLVSVEDIDGNPVLTDEMIPLYKFGSGFVSEDVELNTGQYRLIKFMVINPYGQVVFAAPVQGSPLAYLVNKPLPINFIIKANSVTNISPEVLPVLNHPPGDFGYVNFGVQIVRPLVFYVICLLDNPISSSVIQPTEAKLTVYGNNWHYAFKLEARVNRLIIRGGSDIYSFILEKAGYTPQKMRFTARQLMATSKENPLVLKIPDSSAYKILVLQPGPDAGKDAMVSNLDADKNYGSHPYFEATFLTEPVLTVMRTNRSMIWFNLNSLPKSATIRKVVMTLFYDVPIPWDSVDYTTNPVDSTRPWFGAVLQQIVEPWEEDTVTWNTQPKSIETNQVYLSPFIKNANFIDIDVTRLYVPLNEINYPNYGIFFKLYPTEMFPGFRFASSDYPTASMRPKLTIYYTLPIIAD